MLNFNDIFVDDTKYGMKIPKEKYLSVGLYPVIDQSKEQIAGYTDESEGIYCDVPAIIFGDHTRIIKYVDVPFFLGADGTKLLKIKDNTAFNCKYLYYALSNAKIPNTGYNRHFKWLKELSFDIPSIEKQREIADLMDIIVNLENLRKKQLEKLELFVKSRFVELFLQANESFPKKKLGECTVINPKKSMDTRLKEDLIVSFVPMASVGEDGSIDTSEKKLYREVKSGFTYFIEGDVLFAKITPCMENGKGAVAINLYNGIGFGSTEFHVIRPLEGFTNPVWLYNLSVSKKFRLEAEANMTGSAGQKRTPASFLQNYEIKLPPIELQNQFADFAEQVDKSKLAIQQSLDELETLKKSLMQQYFG